MLARFVAAHPEVTIDLRLDDKYLDLASVGLDLAFRLGHFDQSSLKVRRLGEFHSVLVASPHYLSRYGTPTTPEDLANFRLSSRASLAVNREDNGILRVVNGVTLNDISNCSIALQ